MSGRAKNNLYRVVALILWLAAVAAFVLMVLFPRSGDGFRALYKGENEPYWVAIGALAALLFLPLHVLVHEMGHLLFGLAAGMRFHSVRVGLVRISRERGKLRIRSADSSRAAGEADFYPTSAKGVRTRFSLTALGGALLNLIYAGTLAALYFTLPYHPALLFFALFAPFNLYEGVMALYPAELSAGNTDGMVILGLLKKSPEAIVTLNVLTAQGILYEGTFADIPRQFLFDVPVVREDLPAFAALLQLRWRYAVLKGAYTDAMKALSRLETLYEELDGEERSEIAADLAYMYAVLTPDPARAEPYFAEAGENLTYCLARTAMGEDAEQLKREMQQEPMRGMRDFAEMQLKRIIKKDL